MKKKLLIISIIALVFITYCILFCFNYTNRIIKNDTYSVAPHWFSNVAWKVRDCFIKSELEVCLKRKIVYGISENVIETINKNIDMPNLVGCSAIDAIYILKKSGYKLEIEFVDSHKHEENDIVLHVPSSGENLEPGDTIRIFIEDGLGNNLSNYNNGLPSGPLVVVQGEDIFYYDNEKKAIFKTDYELKDSLPIYEGEVGHLCSIGDNLYFYDFSREKIFKYDIINDDFNVVFDGLIRQMSVTSKAIYFIDANDDFNIKRLPFATGVIEAYIEKRVNYFQIIDENTCIYQYIGDEGVFIGCTDENIRLDYFAQYDNFFYKDNYVYYIDSNNKLKGVEIHTLKKKHLNNNVFSFLLTDGYTFIINNSNGFKDNRSIKGLLGNYKINNKSTNFLNSFTIGNRVFVLTYNGWYVFDGYYLYELQS